MSHDDALDAFISTAKAQDVPPEGAEDQAWAAFAGSLAGGDGDGDGDGDGSDLPGTAEVTTVAGAQGVGLVVKVAVGVALASVAAVGVARWSAPSREPPVSTARSSAPASVATPASAVPPTVPVGAASVVAPEPPSVPPPASVPLEPAPRTRTDNSVAVRQPVSLQPVAPASPSTLAQEARLVGSMWKALDRGDAERALSLAQTHGVRFEGGALSLEARGAALAARCALGRPTDLRELDVVKRSVAPAVAKRISSACTKKP